MTDGADPELNTHGFVAAALGRVGGGIPCTVRWGGIGGRSRNPGWSGNADQGSLASTLGGRGARQGSIREVEVPLCKDLSGGWDGESQGCSGACGCAERITDPHRVNPDVGALRARHGERTVGCRGQCRAIESPLVEEGGIPSRNHKECGGGARVHNQACRGGDNGWELADWWVRSGVNAVEDEGLEYRHMLAVTTVRCLHRSDIAELYEGSGVKYQTVREGLGTDIKVRLQSSQ